MIQKQTLYNPIDVGFSSITSVLSDISKNTDNGNKLLDYIKEYTELTSNLILDSSIDITKAINNLFIGKSKNYSSNMDLNLSDINKYLLFDLDEHQKTHTTLLSSINTILTSIFNELTGKKGNKEDKLKSKEALDAEKDKKDKTGSILTKGKEFLENIINVSKSIVGLSNILNKKFLTQLTKFGVVFEKAITIDEKKLDIFTNGIIKITKSLSDLQKILKPVSISFGIFVLSFVVLALTGAMPFLLVSVGIISGFLWTLNKIFKKGNNLTGEMTHFALGIGILTIAMIAMQFVPLEAMAKMLLFIGGLGLVFKKYGDKVDFSKKIMKFALAIGILTLALIVMAFVPFTAMLKLVLFIAGIGLTLKLFKLDKKKTENPIMSFALGIGILILALLVVEYIPLLSMFKLLLFIVGLGLIMKITGLDKGGAKNPLMSFALGIGILILALLVVEYIPILSMFKLLLFIGGLGLVLKLFNKQGSINMLLIAGGILAISIALFIFKKANISLNDLLILGGVIVTLALIATLLGTPPIVAFAQAGAIVLITLSVALLVFSVGVLVMAKAISIISQTDISIESVLLFIGAVGIIALGFSLIAPLAIVALVGATLMVPVSILSIVIAGSLLLISMMTIDTSKFNESILKTTLTLVICAPLAVIALIGVTLMIPVSALALVVGTAISKLSSLKYDSKNLDNFKLSLGKIIDAFNSIGFISATKASAKALLILPLAHTLNELANIQFSDSSLSQSLNSFLNNLSDSAKWEIIHNNMTILNKNLKEIVSTINMVSLEKALALEKNIKLLSEKATTDGLAELIAKLQQMIDLLLGDKKKPNEKESVIEKISEKNIKDTSKNNKNNDDMMENLISTLNLQLESINNKLNGKLKVCIIDGNSNNLKY